MCHLMMGLPTLFRKNGERRKGFDFKPSSEAVTTLLNIQPAALRLDTLQVAMEVESFSKHRGQ